MKILNKMGLPQAIVNAVNNDPDNNKGTLSVTTLLSPPYQKKRMREHWDDLAEDVSDRIWALFGSSVHHIIERSAGEEDIVEQRLFADCAGTRVSGQLDHLSVDGVLSDWKTTSVWTVKDAKKSGKSEWEQQLNMLAWLVKHGHMKGSLPQVKKVQISAICRDWNNSGAMRDVDYPNKVEVLEYDLWTDDEQYQFIADRVAKHTSDAPEPCTDAERWHRAGKTAVMKKGRKTALRLLDTYWEAEQWIDENGYSGQSNIYIEDRRGSYPRCENYCSVAGFCPTWQKYLEEICDE